MNSALQFHPTQEFWRGRKVLVTGHTGFKGGWLTLWLTKLGAQVSGVALAPDSSPNFFDVLGLEEICDHRLCDIRRLDELLAAFSSARPEIVFHLAAQALVRRSYRDPLETITTNILGTAHAIECARRSASVRAIVNITSDKVYGNRDGLRSHREGDPLGGHDPYSASKASADIIAASYRAAVLPGDKAHALSLATARAGNVIGGGDWAEDRLIPDLVRAFCTGETARIRAPQSVRPWQHVIDVTRGYLMLARALIEVGPSCPPAVNLGPDGKSVSVGEITNLFVKAWGSGAAWHWDCEFETPYESPFLALDPALAYRALGWQPKLTLEQSIAMTATWYRQHADGADTAALRRLSLTQIDAVER